MAPRSRNSNSPTLPVPPESNSLISPTPLDPQPTVSTTPSVPIVAPASPLPPAGDKQIIPTPIGITSNFLENFKSKTSADYSAEAKGEELQPYIPPPTDRFTLEEATEVLIKYQKAFRLSPNQAINSITYWLQSGGYVKSVPNRKETINFKDVPEDLDTLRQIVKDVRSNGTLRQLARAIAQQLSIVAIANGYAGHLFKSLQVINPQIEGADTIYCCEYYQGLPFTPVIVNAALSERSKNRQVVKRPSPNKQQKK